MKKLTAMAVVGLVSLWLLSGVAYAQEWEGKSQTTTVTGIQVELITPAEGLKVGENSLSVRMKEAPGGHAVVRDSVRVDLAMDESDRSMNHGSMSNQKPVVFELKAVASEQGRYEGTATLSDPGDWNLRVFTDARGLGAPASFKVRAEKSGATGEQASGPNWPILGGFALLIVAAIGGVVVVVRKSSASARITPIKDANRA